MKQLSSKCAVITGAASGLGFALARTALDHNMNVVMSDINEAGLIQASENLSCDRHRLATVVADVANADDIQLLCESAKQQFGGTDLLINNAGRITNKFVWEHSAQDWNNIFSVNIGGVANALSTFVPEMIKRDSAAHIVNMGSLASFLPSPLMSSYTASKFSVLALTETLKYELDMLGHDINVSLVAPGPVDTSIFSASGTVNSQHGEQLRRDMSEVIKSIGMKPAEAASIIFDGIKKNKFWIFPHPEMLQSLAERAQTILDCEAPVYENRALEK